VALRIAVGTAAATAVACSQSQALAPILVESTVDAACVMMLMLLLLMLPVLLLLPVLQLLRLKRQCTSCHPQRGQV
jgi:hypothetical protein